MKVFKKNQTVTRKSGGNATDFNIGELDIMGTSASRYNKETVFEIEGTIKLITFDHSKETYCAYLLSKNGVNVGYVYNTYLTKAKYTEKQKLLIKYTKILHDVNQAIELYVDGRFGKPSVLHGKANILEMIINDLEVK